MPRVKYRKESASEPVSDSLLKRDIARRIYECLLAVRSQMVAAGLEEVDDVTLLLHGQAKPQRQVWLALVRLEQLCPPFLTPADEVLDAEALLRHSVVSAHEHLCNLAPGEASYGRDLGAGGGKAQSKVRKRERNQRADKLRRDERLARILRLLVCVFPKSGHPWKPQKAWTAQSPRDDVQEAGFDSLLCQGWSAYCTTETKVGEARRTSSSPLSPTPCQDESTAGPEEFLRRARGRRRWG